MSFRPLFRVFPRETTLHDGARPSQDNGLQSGNPKVQKCAKRLRRVVAEQAFSKPGVCPQHPSCGRDAGSVPTNRIESLNPAGLPLLGLRRGPPESVPGLSPFSEGLGVSDRGPDQNLSEPFSEPFKTGTDPGKSAQNGDRPGEISRTAWDGRAQETENGRGGRDASGEESSLNPDLPDLTGSNAAPGRVCCSQDTRYCMQQCWFQSMDSRSGADIDFLQENFGACGGGEREIGWQEGRGADFECEPRELQATDAGG